MFHVAAATRIMGKEKKKYIYIHMLILQTKHVFSCLNRVKFTCFMVKNLNVSLLFPVLGPFRQEMKVGQLSCVKCGALPREVFSRIAARAGEQWTQNLVQKDGGAVVTTLVEVVAPNGFHEMSLSIIGFYNVSNGLKYQTYRKMVHDGWLMISLSFHRG